MELIDARRVAKGGSEAHYSVLVTIPAGKGFRVYVNQPGARKALLGKPLIISRSGFPDLLFT